MKRLLSLAMLFFFSLISFAQSADEQIGECLNKSDFFLLDEKYSVLKDEMQSPMLKVFSEAILHAVFNRPQQAVASIDELVRDYQGEIGFDNVKNMLEWQNNILFRMGEYQKAYERANSFLEQVKPHLDASTVSQIKRTCEFYKSMCDQKKSELARPDKDCSIPIYLEPIDIKNFKKGHVLYVPATVNGVEEKFIFDTGCPGGNFLSEEYARKFNVKITLDSLKVSGIGGIGWGKMGILDSLSVGNITFKNLTVIVVPPNPAVDTVFQVNAILGSDIIKLAGEVQIFPKEKKMIFPVNKSPMPATGQNLSLNRDDLFSIKVYSNDERLIMNFDTGDSNASLLYNYYKKHKKEVKQKGRKEKLKTGGFGGVKTGDHYILPTFPFRVGNTNFIMKDMGVNTEPINVIAAKDGSFGMGFINLFDKVTISFDQMFVEVE